MRQPADARLAGGGGGADPDPSLEPAEVSRDVLGGDGVSAGGRASGRRRRLLFEQWLLLAVRTLLVVLVVLAVAEPYVERAGLGLRARRTRPSRAGARRLLLDGLSSRPTRRRFERAKELARQIVEESPQGDAFTLVLMSSPPRVVVGTPALEPSEIVRGDRQPAASARRRPICRPRSPRFGRSSTTRRRENPRLARHEVYFLTDLQRVTWAPKLSEAAAAEFSQQTEELAQAATLVVIDLGQPAAENLAVTGLRAADPLVTVGRERATGGRAARTSAARPAAVSRSNCWSMAGGSSRSRSTFRPDGAATVGFSYRFDAPGDHAVEVRAAGRCPGRRQSPLSGRAGAAGDPRAVHRRAAVGRAVPRRGRLPGRGAGAAGPTRPSMRLVQAEVAAESALLERNLGGYDCVFLCNVAQFTASEARVLDAYLQSGGSLVFFLGDQVLADRYNRELGGRGRAGQGGRTSCPPGSAPWSTGRSSASIRWAIGIRSCSRFAAAARPAC